MSDLLILLLILAYISGFIYFANLFEKKDTLKDRVVSKFLHIFYPITILIIIIKNAKRNN